MHPVTAEEPASAKELEGMTHRLTCLLLKVITRFMEEKNPQTLINDRSKNEGSDSGRREASL